MHIWQRVIHLVLWPWGEKCSLIFTISCFSFHVIRNPNPIIIWLFIQNIQSLKKKATNALNSPSVKIDKKKSSVVLCCTEIGDRLVRILAGQIRRIILNSNCYYNPEQRDLKIHSTFVFGRENFNSAYFHQIHICLFIMFLNGTNVLFDLTSFCMLQSWVVVLSVNSLSNLSNKTPNPIVFLVLLMTWYELYLYSNFRVAWKANTFWEH